MPEKSFGWVCLNQKAVFWVSNSYISQKSFDSEFNILCRGNEAYKDCIRLVYRWCSKIQTVNKNRTHFFVTGTLKFLILQAECGR